MPQSYVKIFNNNNNNNNYIDLSLCSLFFLFMYMKLHLNMDTLLSREISAGDNITDFFTVNTTSKSVYPFDLYTLTHISTGFMFYTFSVIIGIKERYLHLSTVLFSTLWEHSVGRYMGIIYTNYSGDSRINIVTDIMSASLAYHILHLLHLLYLRFLPYFDVYGILHKW